jgi:hypothetical protein
VNRIATCLLILSALLFSSVTRLPAQELSADAFLNGVSAHPVGDQAEQDEFLKAYIALNTAPPAEVERVLPSIFQHVRPGNEAHVRGYAVGFLLGIAIRPDTKGLLSSRSENIAALLLDPDPHIQHVAIAITDWAIVGGNPAVYLPALAKAMQSVSTRQPAADSAPAGYDPANDDAANIAKLLLELGSDDPAVVAEIHAFLTRRDLTPNAKVAALNGLGAMSGLPQGIMEDLLHFFDDPNIRVRVAAIMAFANSGSPIYTTNFHNQAKKYVERIATDEQESAKMRQLASDALAGRRPLDPNLDPNIDDGVVAQPSRP